MKLSITLTPELVAMVNFLLETSASATFEEEVSKCVNFGIENRAYRKNYNVKKSRSQKLLALRNAELEAKIKELEALQDN